MIFFLIINLFESLVSSNVIVCDPQTSMLGGCRLQDFNLQWMTLSCNTGWTYWNGKCRPTCELGEFGFGENCLSCSNHCQTCHGPNDFECDICDSSFSINFQNLCSFNCLTSGEFGTPNETTCAYCNTQCSTCFASYDTACTSCDIRSTLAPFEYATNRTGSGYCIPNLENGLSGFFRQYPGDHLVIQCPTNCASCTDRFTCTSCSPGYRLYPPVGSGAQYSNCI